MSKNIENEERVMIDLDGYSKIYKDYISDEKAAHLLIENYYFDDDKLSLRKASHMLRVRITNNRFVELTFKIKGNNGDTEINQDISIQEGMKIAKEVIFPEGEVKEELDRLNHEKIKCLTSLMCDRIEVHLEEHLLVLDKNTYGKTVDYDIEVEASTMEDAKKWIMFYCNKYNFEYKKDYISKSRRAINQALKI